VKYAGITRGIPLSNTNQLWGLLWGLLVFGELRGASSSVLTQVIGGSVVMAIGAGIIALSSVTRSEHARWEEAAIEEAKRYRVDTSYTRARIAGDDAGGKRSRTWIDWAVVTIATAVIAGFALVARPPQIALNTGWAFLLVAATVGMLVAAATALWRATRFN